MNTRKVKRHRNSDKKEATENHKNYCLGTVGNEILGGHCEPERKKITSVTQTKTSVCIANLMGTKIA